MKPSFALTLPLVLSAGCSNLLGLGEFSEASAGAGGMAQSLGGAGGVSAGAGGEGGIPTAGSGGGGEGGSQVGGTGGSSGAGGAGPTAYTIEELRALPDGFVNGVLRDVYVTHVRFNGFHVQAKREGPAVWVFTASKPGVTVGNKVDVEVLKVSTYANTRQLENTTVVSNDNGTYDVVTNLGQTLSVGAGIELGEDLESELVIIDHAVVDSVATTPFVIHYGSRPTSTELLPLADPGLCVGATFDFLGVVVDSTSVPRLFSEQTKDFSNLDTSACSN